METPSSTDVLLLSRLHQSLIASSKTVASPCRAHTLSTELDFGVALTITGSDDITLTLEPGSSRKHKGNLLESDININAPQKTHRIHIDYENLHDPYPEENEDNFLTMEEVYAIIVGDELMSLKDAKNSPNWPEWQIAIQAKLDLLKE